MLLSQNNLDRRKSQYCQNKAYNWFTPTWIMCFAEIYCTLENLMRSQGALPPWPYCFPFSLGKIGCLKYIATLLHVLLCSSISVLLPWSVFFFSMAQWWQIFDYLNLEVQFTWWTMALTLFFLNQGASMVYHNLK